MRSVRMTMLRVIALAYLFTLIGHARLYAEPPDLARLVPNNAGFYAEFRGLNELHQRFESMGVWQALRGYAEGDTTDSDRWQRQTEATLGMTSDELIDTLLGNRAAIFASTPTDWQDGVVIAELRSPAQIAKLLRRWGIKAKAAPETISEHQIGKALNCATHNNLMILGRADASDGGYQRALALLREQSRAHLAGRTDFAALRSYLAETPAGLVYAKWPTSDPYSILGCQALMAGFYFDKATTRCRLVGRLREEDSTYQLIPERFWNLRPNNEIAFLAGHFENRDSMLASSTPSMGERGLLGSLLGGLFPTSSTGTAFEEVMGPYFSLSSLTRKDTGTPLLPDTACVIASQNPKQAVQYIEPVLLLLGNLIKILAPSNADAADAVVIERDEIGGRAVSLLPWGRLLALRTEFSFLSPIVLAWATDRDVVGLATSTRALKSCLDSVTHDDSSSGPATSDVWGRFDERGNGVIECAYLRGTAWSKILESWLSYAEKKHPQLVNDGWWQVWAADRMMREAQLGVGLVKSKSRASAAEVREIGSNSPARGRLKIGDLIIGAGGRSLDASSPARSVAERYHERGAATNFPLIILRDGKRMRVDLRVPPSPDLRLASFKPITSIRKIGQLLGGIKSIAYMRYRTKPGWLDAEVIVDWAEAN